MGSYCIAWAHLKLEVSNNPSTFCASGAAGSYQCAWFINILLRVYKTHLADTLLVWAWEKSVFEEMRVKSGREVLDFLGECLRKAHRAA